MAYFNLKQEIIHLEGFDFKTSGMRVVQNPPDYPSEGLEFFRMLLP